MRLSSRRRSGVVLTAVALLAASAGVAYATHETGGEDAVHLCHNARTGVVRVVADPGACTRGEDATDVATYQAAVAPPEARNRFVEEVSLPDISGGGSGPAAVILEFDLPSGHWSGAGQGVFWNDGPGRAHVECSVLEFADGASGFSNFIIEPFDIDVVPFSWLLEVADDSAQNLRLACTAEGDGEAPPEAVVLRDLSLTFTRVSFFCEPPCLAG